MFNFDPRSVRPYIPPDCSPLIDVVTEIINITAEARIDASEDMLNSDLLRDDDYEIVAEEMERTELGLITGSILVDEDKLDWAWRYLWKYLIEGTYIAQAVDARCRIHRVDPHFWTTEYAVETFRSGEIKEIPPYIPHGRVILSNQDIQAISALQYRLVYASVLPAAPGASYDEVEVQNLFAHSLVGETAAMEARRSGTHPTHDKELFLIEVFATVHRLKLFKSKSELVRLATDAYMMRKTGARRPSKRWADDVVAKVWDRLGLRDTPVSELRRTPERSPGS